MTNLTTETLRHYDRIGLVTPSHKDHRTGYRYYSKQEIVRLNTIQALRCMDLSLQEIKNVLTYDDLEKIVEFLEQADKKADEKIAELRYSKSKIQLAKNEYQKKLLQQQEIKEIVIKKIPKRTLLLSRTLTFPSLDNLWNYHSHFYQQIEAPLRDDFKFEDLAGIYTDQEQSSLFVVCLSHKEVEGIKILPEGTYLCGNCRDENRELMLEQLTDIAKEDYGIEPKFTVQLIIVSGILNWNYQIQLYLGA